MSYRLKEKENEFQVTREGSFEFYTFRHGVTYEKVPEEDLAKFDLTNPSPLGIESQRLGGEGKGEGEPKKTKK